MNKAFASQADLEEKEVTFANAAGEPLSNWGCADTANSSWRHNTEIRAQMTEPHRTWRHSDAARTDTKRRPGP